MLRLPTILSLLLIITQVLPAQIRPLDGSILNYITIGFIVPEEPRSLDYTFEIASGSFNNPDSFSRHIIKTIQSKSNKIVERVPSFGSQYTWRIVYSFKQSNKTISSLFHFATASVPEVDTNLVRLKITTAAGAYKDAYVFLDDNKTLYDMSGNPVWFLPKLEGHAVTPRNMKISRQGTITFVSDPPYEINYDGEILWKPPAAATVSGDNSEHFHHQFTRLANGHYMVLGEDSAYYNSKQPTAAAGNSESRKDAANEGQIAGKKIQFGNIIEYDESGKVVWYWKSSDYFTKTHPDYMIPPADGTDLDVHKNSFHFDEKKQYVYISFKNINRILKIKYPEGTVVNDYGGINKQGTTDNNLSLFCGQHSIKQTHDGNIMLFNNNNCHPGSLPTVEILEEPQTDKDTLKLLWEYACASPYQSSYGFPAGGNVIELTDRSIFVSTAAPDSKVFIVNRNKEIIWSALPQRWNDAEKKWNPIPEYRASIIQNKEALERLIWHEDANELQAVREINSNAGEGNKEGTTGSQ